jgi:hypothetical protein
MNSKKSVSICRPVADFGIAQNAGQPSALFDHPAGGFLKESVASKYPPPPNCWSPVVSWPF